MVPQDEAAAGFPEEASHLEGRWAAVQEVPAGNKLIVRAQIEPYEHFVQFIGTAVNVSEDPGRHGVPAWRTAPCSTYRSPRVPAQ